MTNNDRGRSFASYEYKEVSGSSTRVSMYLDGYFNFGWNIDENFINPQNRIMGVETVQIKRDRRIVNKIELTRLQRNFEDCMRQIDQLERSKTTKATVVSLIIGIIGTAFIAGSVFAVTHEPPIIWLTILLAIPGAIGWALPYPIFRKMAIEDSKKMETLIDNKYSEIADICKKGSRLLEQ
ncbi:MAG: hypothetical protein ACK5LL_13625 [Suipraeoptans sp.]